MQKYKRGATRLAQIASALGVSVGKLFESFRAESRRLNSPVQLFAEPDALRVLEAYARTRGIASTVTRLVVDRGERHRLPSRR